MKKGKVIYLNGVTSSGKTSIVRALRERGDVSFYYLSDDIFEDCIIDVEYGAPGYWEALAEAVFLMYRTAKLFRDQGKTVVIDSMLLERPEFAPHYAQMLEIFGDTPPLVVEVACPLEICRQRNLLRADRLELQSREQAAVMARNVSYALRLDTQRLSPEACAEIIVRELVER